MAGELSSVVPASVASASHLALSGPLLTSGTGNDRFSSESYRGYRDLFTTDTFSAAPRALGHL